MSTALMKTSMFPNTDYAGRFWCGRSQRNIPFLIQQGTAPYQEVNNQPSPLTHKDGVQYVPKQILILIPKGPPSSYSTSYYSKWPAVVNEVPYKYNNSYP
jgi:hypothetical protein